MEALAAWTAAEFVMEIGINQVIIEGDSEVIYKYLIDPGPSHALHGHLICDVLQLASVFSLCSFNNVGRTGNYVAHNLARRAILTHDLNVWMEEVPPDILQFEQAVEREKFPTYHNLTYYTIKSTKYSQLQSTTYCC